MSTNSDRLADLLADLDTSPLSGALREDLREVARSTERGANGLPTAQKLAAVAQGLFDLTRITIYQMIHQARHPARSWRDVVVECRAWICVLAGIIAVALIIRPELRGIAAAIAHPPAP